MAHIVLGAVAFGKPKPTNKDHPLSTDERCEELLRLFTKYGGTELDTARVYQDGNSEAMIGRLMAKDGLEGLKIATKYHPALPGGPIAQVDQSLDALKMDKIDILYIHMPATEIALEDTLKEINQCHVDGKIEEFGLSNFPAWQVVEICQFCNRMGYVMPTVYQGVYNALNRTSEYELVPVLRNYNIKYYTHGSLASGFLTGKYKKGVPPVKGVDRFAQKRRVQQYEERYLKRDEMFAALDVVTQAAEKAGVTVLEAAVRWTQHHSPAVDAARGDAVLIGVSRIVMAASRQGPLPREVVTAFERANDIVKMKSEYYLQFPYPKEGSPWHSRL